MISSGYINSRGGNIINNQLFFEGVNIMDLREARFKARISQWELAKRTGVHQSRISLIENGHPAKEEEKTKLSAELRLKKEKIQWAN